MALSWTATVEYGYPTWKTEIVEHGLKDGKGRSIGNVARIEERPVFGPTGERSIGGWELQGPTGAVVYCVSTRATRNGEIFGAISSHTEVGTLEEAKKLGDKKMVDAGKRYAKLVAKGEGRQFEK